MVLQRLEAQTHQPVSHMFDLIAGTSTGGILAVALTTPMNPSIKYPRYSASDLVSFYKTEGPKIFKKSPWRTIRSFAGLLDEKYPSEQLEKPLRGVLGDAKLSASMTKVLVSAYDLQNRKPLFFKSDKATKSAEDDFPIWQVAKGTASAPTYFEPTLAQSFAFGRYPVIDGGVFATNVAMHAYAEARALWPNEEYHILSLGCGEMLGPYDYKKLSTGELGWIAPLLDIMLQGSSATVDYQMRQIAKNYVRLQPRLKHASDAMDDASEKNLSLLANEADDLIAHNQSQLDTVAKLLMDNIPVGVH
jgi:patatin-like phospholipase/acyl hydrolase